MSYGKFWSSAEVVVPDVTGKQMTLAKQILEDKKLRVNVAETYDATVPAGQVVSQTPEAGSKVKEERLVTIYVSKGGEEIEMPDLKGLSKSAAEDKLKKLGLKLGTVSEKYSSEESGTVLSQDPRAGVKINKGQAVDLVVSKGENEKNKRATVPDVSGASLDAAEASIVSHGFKVGSITKRASQQAEGTVISQSPSAGSDLTAGASISLVIAEPEKIQDKTSKQQDTATKAPSKKNESGKTDK